MNKRIFTFGLMAFMCTYAFTQEKETRPVQVSFIYPIGTAGNSSINYSNNFSFNVLGGLNGGVNGFEFGSIFNLNKGNVKGFQLSGIVNVTSENSAGMIFSGVGNINKGSLKGFQLCGVFNKSNEVKGLQLSVVNIANKHSSGVQIGVFNLSRNSNGAQLGIVNVSDSTSGVPIGLVNIVKGGYYALELTANEVIYGKLSFKTGTEKFYNIFSVGISGYEGKINFSQGLGFGTLIKLGEKSQTLAIELEGNNIVYDNNWSDNLNLLSTLRFNYQYPLTKSLRLSIGPTINSYITNQKVNGDFGSIHVPYTIYENEGDSNRHSLWVGANAGILFTL